MINEFRLGMGVDSVKLCCKFCCNDLNVFKNLRTSILWIKVSYSHLQQLMYKVINFNLTLILVLVKVQYGTNTLSSITETQKVHQTNGFFFIFI